MRIDVKKLTNPWTALGLAAHFVARHEPFSGFRSGDLIRTLSAQVERGHYHLALEGGRNPARVLGYCGWSLLTHEAAERFAATGKPPMGADATDGEVLWILTAVTANRDAFFALVRETRALYPRHRIMAIRHKQGRRVVFDQWRERGAGRGANGDQGA